jgi:uncharacterized membrane protein YkoI
MNTLVPVSLLAAASLYLASLLTFAADPSTDDVAELIKSGQILSQEAIIKRATDQHPGRVSEAELERKGGRYVYEVDIVNDKGVKTELELDAKTGEVLSTETDNDDEAENNSEADEDDDD